MLRHRPTDGVSCASDRVTVVCFPVVRIGAPSRVRARAASISRWSRRATTHLRRFDALWWMHAAAAWRGQARYLPRTHVQPGAPALAARRNSLLARRDRLLTAPSVRMTSDTWRRGWDGNRAALSFPGCDLGEARCWNPSVFGPVDVHHLTDFSCVDSAHLIGAGRNSGDDAELEWGVAREPIPPHPAGWKQLAEGHALTRVRYRRCGLRGARAARRHGCTGFSLQVPPGLGCRDGSVEWWALNGSGPRSRRSRT